jgi:ArsR family transcriptional regulator
MPDLLAREDRALAAANILRAIAHPLRLRVLCAVSKGEACVQDILEKVGTSQSNVSQHLALLRKKGVLYARKDGNRVFYGIADQRIMHLMHEMHGLFCSS